MADNPFRPPPPFPVPEGESAPKHQRPEENDAERQSAPTSGADRREPAPSVPRQTAPIDIEMRDGTAGARKQDLLHDVQGLYRLLDLISEQSSGGTVDKIIIDQDSINHFVNTVSPGAYHSMTRVDFKTLDNLTLQPEGIYGPKREIVKFLKDLRTVSPEIATKLLTAKQGSGLRSGLYLLRPSRDTSRTYIIYWPEDTTWDDRCVGSVRRNRITFMRYLSKLVRQTTCIVSPEHAASIVWKEDTESDMLLDAEEDDNFDRMFSFEVAKSNQQDEEVSMRPGFELADKHVDTPDSDGLPEEINPERLRTRFLPGETGQAFVTISYKPPSQVRSEFVEEVFHPMRLESEIERARRISILPGADEETVINLCGRLKKYYPEAIAGYRTRSDVTKKEIDAWTKDKLAEVKAQSPKESDVEEILEFYVAQKVADACPIYHQDELVCSDTKAKFAESSQDTAQPQSQSQADPLLNDQDTSVQKNNPPKLDAKVALEQLVNLHPEVSLELEKVDSGKILNSRFLSIKKRLVACKDYFDNPDLSLDARTAFVDDALKPGRFHEIVAAAEKKGLLSKLWNVVVGGAAEWRIRERLDARANEIPNPSFLCNLDQYQELDQRLRPFCNEVRCLALEDLQAVVRKQTKTRAAHIIQAMQDQTKKQIKRDAEGRKESIERRSREQFINDIDVANEGHPCHIYLASVVQRRNYTMDDAVLVSGFKVQGTIATLVHDVRVLQITQEDKHNLQMNRKFVPSPHINDRLNYRFELPIGYKLLHLQLVEADKILLVYEDDKGGVFIYLERGELLDSAIKHSRCKKQVHKDKLGDTDLMFAYDQQKRMLLICAPHKLQLHLFVFDESYRLQGWGTALSLAAWYSDRDISIVHACFVLNSEEILLVDSTPQARIYSIVAQQFRPATVSLNAIPTAVYTSPDGSCLIMSQDDEYDEKTSIHAYHWSTFGSGDPFTHELPFLSSAPLLLTSFGKTSAIHIVGLDFKQHAIRSFALDITTKITEFQFTAQGGQRTDTQQQQTSHNSLIDCHADVWTRFPVRAAIPNHINMVTDAKTSLTFATDRDFDKYEAHFSNLVQTFEQTTRKPTEGLLKKIVINAVQANELSDYLRSAPVTEFCLGSWLVSFFCLIPIHVAVTHENRFLPLKDGVVSPEWEKELLGAEVGKIVDSLSLGWYESIFQSSRLPVRVVSSMGEQSVGKSYTLNHLVDSSFAGSAMRTTEGVWLSCTPTRDALIVALDFEGVHSIERSAQEDTLLVLFNTAISNLVLFRNNFALSRDITGLFQSFQSSSTVLNPDANPDLFQSTLVIIIKDVTDSDTNEITREFALKFQNIVRDEQETNFISRLHRGKLDIVPWPVIESKKFYTLFGGVRNKLYKQVITHPAGGQFLLTLKTLMAKLKTNDWGSISQTLVAHRAQKLAALLPAALMFALAETEPQEEPLKNFDSDEIIGNPDERQPFLWLKHDSAPMPLDQALSALCQSWPKFLLRDTTPESDWIAGLSAYLQEIVEFRTSLVRAWIESNLSRFTATHESIDLLWREFERLKVEMKTSVELCRMKCGSCNLQCISNRVHDADEAHTCHTDHKCSNACHYADGHMEDETVQVCGYPAGHSGNHICAVSRHLCGERCMLYDKGGCLEKCTHPTNHEGDHLCPSKTHACGLPCNLHCTAYDCAGTCTISSDEQHDEHICENKMCPIPCQLCKRLCSSSNHLHALELGADHLCGQEHSCMKLCASPGSCEIETAPQSIKATFTGRHETFEYTKYSQVAKRLKCSIVIPAGDLTHRGAHTHTTDPTRIHFCESRCENCGYYCMLPLGHPQLQQQHETSHGSMSKTKWAIDGPAGTTLDVDGHKFGSEDDGAPMMCNLVCTNMGRHAHLDFCRAPDAAQCTGADIAHISGQRLNPEPARSKDWISHTLFWKRSGFKDPYSRDEQTNFAKCDAMCSGPEHKGNANAPAEPSYCILPLFHAPDTLTNVGLGHRSHDGHIFKCKNPAVLQQAFHVIFVIDRSGSMTLTDRRPLATPVSAQIQRVADNRLGAVYSALYGFWTSRSAATTTTTAQAGRRDAYSVVLFDTSASTVLSNDFTTDVNGLLNTLLRYSAGGGTSFVRALDEAKRVMLANWSSERTPVVVFLSDGEDSVADASVQDIARAAIARGKALSLHTVSFGCRAEVLRRMAAVALDIQRGAPVDPAAQGNARIDSSFSEALDSVQLASTFLAIADSLRKPRGALMQA